MRTPEHDTSGAAGQARCGCAVGTKARGIGAHAEILLAFPEANQSCAPCELSAERARAFEHVFGHLVDSAKLPGVLRWSFSNEPGVERCVRELARSEHRCWPQLTFAVSVQHDRVIWQACGMADEALEALARVPSPRSRRTL